MKKFLIVACLLMIVVSTLYSQNDSVVYHLPPIIITATRSPETSIEVPLAISVIEAKEIQQLRGYGIDEALGIIPGVLGQSRYGNQDVRLTIRGFGARGAGERSNAGTSRGVRVLIDGLPETEPDGRTSFDLIELSSANRIEVIRSNASALWGNASGGVVNLISNTSFKNPFVNLQSSLGSFGYRKELVNLGTNIGSGKVFLTFSNTNFDGWREHSASTRALIHSGIHSPIGKQTYLAVYLTATSNLFKIPGPLTPPQFDENPRQAQNDTLNYNPTYVQRDERRFNRLGRLAAQLSHEFDNKNSITTSIFVTPKVLQRSERNTFRDFTRYHVGGNFIYRNSLILNPDLKNTLLLGADEAYQDGAILFYNLLDGRRGPTLRTNKREGANNLGVFIQDELIVKERTRVLLGLRYDNVTYYCEDFRDQRIKGERSFKKITPKAGLTYRFGTTHSIYANLGGGVEVPAANEIDPDKKGPDSLSAINPLLEPIRSLTLELGTKQIVWFEKKNSINMIQYDVALYWIQIKNDIIPYQSGAFYTTAGRTQRMGIELGFSSHFNFGFSLLTSFTYSSNKYKEYILDSNYTDPRSPDNFADFKNNKISGIPDFYYKNSLRYTPSFIPNIYYELTLQGVGKYFADDANRVTVPQYNILNATIGTDNISINKNFSVRGFVSINNLLNKKYASSAFINPDYDKNKIHPIYLEPGLPRNYNGSFSVNWNF